jgi:hypothetical protein
MGLQHYYYPQAKLDASPRQGGLFRGGKDNNELEKHGGFKFEPIKRSPVSLFHKQPTRS